ncbi:MAG: ABC transporter permease [Alphaproteobacteria bacterium]|nr:ABC transporter permease [Alphaproteobacteria bacterium]MCB9792104.1 ABC transporter permease [Alphaproteobacteria bacterium]
MAAQDQSFRARVWRDLKRHRSGFAGLVIVAVLMVIALLAPLIANDRPIVASYKGDIVFPAFPTYVDSWVPWASMRNELQSTEIGEGYFPFSPYYASLEGQSWKQVADSEDLGFAIWPLVKWNPSQFDSTALKKGPGEVEGHLLGTDDQGRDVLSRLIHGTVVAMLVGIVAMSISCGIGITLGLAAGYLGGWTDIVLSRLTEVVMCFPTFFLIIAVIAFLEPSIVNIMMVLGLVGWTRIFRLVRGEVLKCRSEEYVLAAKALGLPSWRVMFAHVLPNSISPVFVAIAFGVASAVLAETSLSFLGFGDASVPSWGEIVKQGRAYVSQGLWHLTIFPGLAIFVTLTSFNLLGQGLRDVLDPKLRE